MNSLRIILIALSSSIAFLFSITNLPAQTFQSAPIVLDNLQEVPLASFTYYEDPTGDRKAVEVIQDDFQHSFNPSPPENLTLGYSNSHYWLAFTVKNPKNNGVWYLAADHPLMQASIYQILDDKTLVKQPIIDGRYPINRLKFSTNETSHFLIHARSKAAVSLQFKLLTEPALSRRLYQETVLLALISGCFLAMIFYNLFLYLSLRDRNYLYYLFFAVVNSHLDLLTVNFPDGIWNWFKIPWWDIINFYRLLAPFTTLLFVRSFLQIKETHPRLDHCFSVYIFGLIPLMLGNFFINSATLMTLIDIYFLLSMPLFFYAGIYRLRQGFRPARYYLAGLGIFLIGVCVCLMQMMGWLPTHPLTINAILVAQALEMILMSLALGGKIKLLQEEKTRAEVTSDVKSHLLRIISHDIANPLTIVKMQSQRLHTEQPASKPVASILRAVNIIEEIMRFVQKTSTLNQGMSISMTSVPLAEVFAKLSFLFQEKAKEKGISLQFKLESPDLAVYAETVSFSNEVLSNLLSNAIKFSSAGDVIQLEACKHKDGLILITVKDEGVGMSPSILANLFDPHQNFSLPGTQGEKGIGYGMPLAKAFLDAYGARIEVESTSIDADPDRSGTTFRILISAAQHKL